MHACAVEVGDDCRVPLRQLRRRRRIGIVVFVQGIAFTDYAHHSFGGAIVSAQLIEVDRPAVGQRRGSVQLIACLAIQILTAEPTERGAVKR
jgi:hypothetical protein